MTNDVFDINNDVQYSLYADDETIWVTCITVEEGIANMKVAIDRVIDWCDTWGFHLTAKKTKAMIFSRSRKFPQLSLRPVEHNIEFVSQINF